MFAVKNNAEDTVQDNPLSSGATQMTVSDDSNFPSEYPFRLTIWDSNASKDPDGDSDMEIVEVTGSGGTNVLNIERGKEGTSAVEHQQGETCALLITAGIFEDADNGIYQALNSAGGATVQNTEPAYSEGKFWLNDDTGVLRVGYDKGGGGDFYPVSPIAVIEEIDGLDLVDYKALDFDMALTHNNTKKDIDKIGLVHNSVIFDWEDGNNTPEDSDWSWSGNLASDEWEIEPLISDLKEFGSRTLTLFPNYSETAAERSSAVTVEKDKHVLGIGVKGHEVSSTSDHSKYSYFTYVGSDGNFIAKAGTKKEENNYNTIFWMQADDEFTLENRVQYVEFRNIDTSNNTADIYLNGVLHKTGFNLYPNWSGDVKSLFCDCDSVTNASYPIFRAPSGITATSGDTIIDFGAKPSDFDGWDIVDYHAVAGDGSVTVDVEDGNGTVLYSDIPRNFDISTVSTGTNIQLHIYFSRPDDTNETYVDYVARRYVQ